MRRFITVGLLSDPQARLMLMGLVLNAFGVATIVAAYLAGNWSRSPTTLSGELAMAALFEVTGAAIVLLVLGKLLLGGFRRR